MKTNGWTGIYAVDRDCVCIGTDAGISPATEMEIQLMCEAGTVANETGLSPRELLAQRDMLLKALAVYANGSWEEGGGVTPNEPEYAYETDFGKIAMEAIAKTSGGSE